MFPVQEFMVYVCLRDMLTFINSSKDLRIMLYDSKHW